MSQIGRHFKLGENKPQESKFISFFILIGQELNKLMFKRIYNVKVHVNLLRLIFSMFLQWLCSKNVNK